MTIWNARRVALGIFSGNIIFIFVFGAACGPLQTHFHEKGVITVRRVSDSKSAEHKKSFSAATWIFCMEPFFFGIIKGEQPLIRASRASKVAGAFLVLFWHAKENIPGGAASCKSH